MNYNSLPEYTDKEIATILESNDIDKIMLLPLSIGEYCEDYEYSVKLCAEFLCHSDNDLIRANAALGLAYISRRFKMMDKRIVKLLKNELKKNIYASRIEDALDDIRIFAKSYK